MRRPTQALAEIAGFTRSALEAAANDRDDLSAIRLTQQRRMDALLASAHRTPLYRKRIPHVGTPLADMEPLTKAELQDDLPASVVGGAFDREALQRFVSSPKNIGKLFDDRYLVAMTSGTTGAMGFFLHDLPSWALTRGVTFSRIFRDNWNAADALRFMRYLRYRMSFVVAAGGHYMTYLLASRLPKIAKIKFDANVYSVEQPIEELVASLNAHAPHLLHSYPTVLELLCFEQKAGRLRIQPELITAGSEPLTASCREAVRVAFPYARLVETYASTECVSMATSCRLGNLHVNEDACILEPVSSSGEPVDLDVLGERLWVTNLLNTAQPLLRYELTDSVRLLSAPCDCGSPFRRIEVQGRSDDTFYLEDERGQLQAHPPIPLELLFLRIPGLVQYQLIHEAQNRLQVLFVAETQNASSQVHTILQGQLERYLTEHGLVRSVKVRFEEVDAIPRGAQSKKMRQILSHVAKPPGAALPAHTFRRALDVQGREF